MKLKKLLIISLLTAPILGMTACDLDNDTDNTIVETDNTVTLTLICKSDDGMVDSTATLLVNKNEIWNKMNPIVKDYQFKGWFYDDDYIIKIDDNFIPTKNITLYGKFEKDI